MNHYASHVQTFDKVKEIILRLDANAHHRCSRKLEKRRAWPSASHVERPATGEENAERNPDNKRMEPI